MFTQPVMRLINQLDSCPWSGAAGRRVVPKQPVPRPLYTAEERRRRDASPWTTVQGVLAPLTPGSASSHRQTLAEVIVHVTYSMLNFSIRDGQSHPDAVVQLKSMLTHYLLATEAEAARQRTSA